MIEQRHERDGSPDHLCQPRLPYRPLRFFLRKRNWNDGVKPLSPAPHVRPGPSWRTPSEQAPERPDRLIGLILLGNNFVNIAASSLATLIALELWGNAGVPLAAFILTVVILIFAEVAPKTIAAVQPERVAYTASFILLPLLKAMYPLVASINWVANGLLEAFGFSTKDGASDRLSAAELRTVVNEADVHISMRHRSMLVSILDLDTVSVDDIMVPRSDVRGLDLEDSERTIFEMLMHTQHTRLPVYRGDIDNVIEFYTSGVSYTLCDTTTSRKTSSFRPVTNPILYPPAHHSTLSYLTFSVVRSASDSWLTSTATFKAW